MFRLPNPFFTVFGVPNTIKELSIDDYQANRANSNRASSKEKRVVEVYSEQKKRKEGLV